MKKAERCEATDGTADCDPEADSQRGGGSDAASATDKHAPANDVEAAPTGLHASAEQAAVLCPATTAGRCTAASKVSKHVQNKLAIKPGVPLGTADGGDCDNGH